LSIVEALAAAERYRGEGRLDEAEQLCRRILDGDPNSPDAEALLGLVAHQGGRLPEAIKHMRRATELAPGVAPPPKISVLRYWFPRCRELRLTIASWRDVRR
jgi:tetratricopeptide (TPR) repeat protein